LCQLRFDLAVERNTYEVGEPIQLSLRLTNTGTTQIQIQHTSDVTGRHDGYRFEVLDEDGRQVPDPGGASSSLREALGSIVSVAPRGTDNRRFTLNYHVAPLKPGRYSVKGLFRSSYPQPGLDAESNRVVISIQPTSPDRLRQRVSDLTRDLEVDVRRGAAFLGFTGDVAAIPPLIDLLYRKDDGVQVAAVDALLYLDRGTVEGSLLDALKQRGARERMVHLLVVNIATPNALMRPALIQSLRSADSDARTGAVEGLRLLNSARDPELFAPLAAMLGDPVAAVRHKASAAVGGYQNQQALTALTPLVDDTDTSVSEQATIAVGWIAQASAIGSDTRKGAIIVLQRAAESRRRPVSEQARTWLSNVGAR
jgi:HEAT repeat protein